MARYGVKISKGRKGVYAAVAEDVGEECCVRREAEEMLWWWWWLRRCSCSTMFNSRSE